MKVEIAKPDDVDEILEFIRELSAWLETKGIQQWSQGYPRKLIETDVQNNFVYVVRDSESIIATVTLTNHRDSYWKDFEGEAIYLHRLAVRRSSAGKNLGSMLIEWAMNDVRARGVPMLRLDCDSQNVYLRNYYGSLGFRFRGVRRVDEYNMEFALFEKHALPQSPS